jgi:hypothetical protein
LFDTRTHNALPLEAAAEKFRRRGLIMIPLANDGPSQFHRMGTVRGDMLIPNRFRIQQGFNRRLVECVSRAKSHIVTLTTPDSRREAVVHDQYSHCVFALGGFVANWSEAASKPAPAHYATRDIGEWLGLQPADPYEVLPGWRDESGYVGLI